MPFVKLLSNSERSHSIAGRNHINDGNPRNLPEPDATARAMFFAGKSIGRVCTCRSLGHGGPLALLFRAQLCRESASTALASRQHCTEILMKITSSAHQLLEAILSASIPQLLGLQAEGRSGLSRSAHDYLQQEVTGQRLYAPAAAVTLAAKRKAKARVTSLFQGPNSSTARMPASATTGNTSEGLHRKHAVVGNYRLLTWTCLIRCRSGGCSAVCHQPCAPIMQQVPLTLV